MPPTLDLPAFYEALRAHFAGVQAQLAQPVSPSGGRGANPAPASPPASSPYAELSRLKLAPFASPPDAFRPAPLLVVSMKPYGAPGRAYPFGWEERAARPDLHRWYDGRRATGNFVREADALLTVVLAALGGDLSPRRVPNTYAYFYRARDAAQLKSFGLERVDCSVFHRTFLEVVQPKLVLCLGNGPAPSAFALYRDLLKPETVHEEAPAARVKVRWFRADDRLVVGVPHLSYLRAEAVIPTVTDLITNRLAR